MVIRPSRGFSLVEAMVSLIIVGVVIVGALTATGSAARMRSSTVAKDRALALAQGLAQEIMQAAYEDAGDDRTFGPEAGELSPPWQRSKFDDVDDYDGWSSGPPRKRNGVPIPGAGEFTRHVEVRFVSIDDPDGVGATDVAQETSLKRVRVSAVGPRTNATVTLLRGRTGTADREPSRAGTFVRWVGVTLRLGEGGHAINSGTSVLNQIELETEDTP